MTFKELCDAQPELLNAGFDGVDAQVVKDFLGHPSVRKALAIIIFQRSKIAAELLGMDFENQLTKAVQAQGQVRGINWAVEKLFELSEPPEEEEE